MSNYELYHHGVKGQKWGVRRFQKKDGSLTPSGKKRYSSTGIRAAIARRQNEKVDKGFKDWKENAKKRDDAIELGKKANEAKLEFEKNVKNKELREAYKTADKEYRKSLSKNTTYRKGVVRKEVGSHLSRKYLSEAKKVKKQLDKDPSNIQLQKQYNSLMSKHDVERAKARRAPEVAAKRSARKASAKRAMTMTVKAVAATAAVAAGAYAINRYMVKHDVRLNGRPVRVKGDNIIDFGKAVKRGKDFLGYFY